MCDVDICVKNGIAVPKFANFWSPNDNSLHRHHCGWTVAYNPVEIVFSLHGLPNNTFWNSPALEQSWFPQSTERILSPENSSEPMPPPTNAHHRCDRNSTPTTTISRRYCPSERCIHKPY